LSGAAGMGAPRTHEFTIDSLAAFDDEALRTFLDPLDSGIDCHDLGVACCDLSAPLTQRIRSNLPQEQLARFDEAVAARVGAEDAAHTRTIIVERLFWPFVYWNEPDEYDELVSGEHIHPEVLSALELDGRAVCDIGAGTGRFTLLAAARARQVIAVDAVPALLERLMQKAARAGFENVTVRRGRFCSLPLEDGSVDIAVACSAFTDQGPHGGERALREAERIVRTGGQVAVIWPQNRRWLEDRGFIYRCSSGNDVMHFRDVATAERLCERYYSESAAAWVREHASSEVPFAVLGTSPPNDICLKRIR
jgi:ubiquinone/menaquinone biosynthesis C-methylase UbiE